MKYTIKTSQPKVSLRGDTKVPHGLGTPEEISDEIQDMFNVLLARASSPVSPLNTLALMEVADAYYMRVSEITYKIHRLEREGSIQRGDEYYKLRTGELNDFLDACKRTADLGSRRLSALQLEHEQSKLGRESAN